MLQRRVGRVQKEMFSNKDRSNTFAALCECQDMCLLMYKYLCTLTSLGKHSCHMNKLDVLKRLHTYR